MIAVISSISIVIASLVITLVTSNPNFYNIMESNFLRSAKNNEFVHSWEWAQLQVRTGQLDKSTATKTTLGPSCLYGDSKNCSDKDSGTQKLKSDITLTPSTGAIGITLDKQ